MRLLVLSYVYVISHLSNPLGFPPAHYGSVRRLLCYEAARVDLSHKPDEIRPNNNNKK